MSKKISAAQAAYELSVGYRCAKWMLQIEHKTCSFCDAPSVGVHPAIRSMEQGRIVLARCEEHWGEIVKTEAESGHRWHDAIRWDHLEDIEWSDAAEDAEDE